MLSDRDALLAAICAHPDEDTPRLVFADWLQENGESERAEFTRLQCELAGYTHDGSDSQAVYEFLRDRDWVTRPAVDWTKVDDGIHRRIVGATRNEELLNQFGSAWEPKLPKKYGVHWDGFHRGFPHRVTLSDARKLKPGAERLRATVPAVTLLSDDFTPAFVEQLGEAGLLGWLSGLELQRDFAEGLHKFGHRPEARNVRALTLRHGDARGVATHLADAPNWTGLRTLDLALVGTEASGAEELFRSPNLRGLRRLHMHGYSDWTTDTVRALAAGGFNELNSLRLVHCGLNDDAAEVLADCPALAKLRTLDLGHNQIGGRGVTALLCSPHLANVAFLGLESNPLTGLDAPKLAALSPAGLRMLHAHSGRFRTADVRALARCPRLRTVWYFDLDDNNLGTAAVREMVRGFGKWCPPIVWLTYNRIDDRGAKLLADWKAATGLRALHVKYNQGISDAGVQALLDSANLTNLDALGVPETTVETQARLKARFKQPDGY